MDSMERLKKAVENIELDADARARISARLAGAKEPARPRRRIRAGVLVAAAAAAALLVTGAGAAYIRNTATRRLWTAGRPSPRRLIPRPRNG